MKIGWSCEMFGRKNKQREEKMGWLFGMWVVECVFCEKGAKKRNHGGKKNKNNNKIKKERRQGYDLDVGIWAEVWGVGEGRWRREEIKLREEREERGYIYNIIIKIITNKNKNKTIYKIIKTNN